MGFWNRLFGDNRKHSLSTSSDKTSEDVQMMLKDIIILSTPQDIPKKIEMLYRALSLLRRQSNPELWAFLHTELGVNLHQNPQSDQSNNIEKAIEHYNQALEVHTYKAFPDKWAIIQNNLGGAYWKRIKGNKAENIEEAIKYYNQALIVQTQNDFPVDWAMALDNLAHIFIDRIRGDRAENIERAIEYCNQALKVRTLNDFPVAWALTQNNLGTAYWSRVKGSKADNIEEAIKYYNQALIVQTQKESPVDWAGTQNNLALSYWKRIKGEKAENIEKAIEYYNQALKVFVYEAFPTAWALVQNNLAIAYNDRIREDRAENLEHAIEHYNQALVVRTQNDNPVDWAMTQNNLAVTYNNRVKGDRAENVEKAIELYNQILKVYTYQDFPVDWANTHHNLAIAYKKRILGNKAENIEKAIEYCNQALEVRTYTDFPIDWADTQNNLANAYRDRTWGDRAENIERAIKHYKKSLRVRTYQDFPIDWADTQNNLGLAYKKRFQGYSTENIEKAIEHYNQALKVYTQKDFPVDWATIQNNLANAYFERIKENRAENVEKAISYCYNALKIFKFGLVPNDFRKTCRLLGDLYLETGRWKDAVENYRDAIKAGDILYRSGLSAETKLVEVKENGYLYRNATLAACRMGLAREALLILEAGKTRLLSEALQLRMKQPDGVPNEQWVKYEQAAERYRNITKSSSLEKDYVQQEKEAQKALKELEGSVKLVQRYNLRFQEEFDILDILSIPDTKTALITICITDKGSIGFIVSKLNGVQSVDMPRFRTEDLDKLLFQSNGMESIRGGWVGDYQSFIHSPCSTSYKSTFQTWQKTLNDVLSSIGKLLCPLLVELPPQIERLIFLPSAGLFLLPLHAIPLSNGQLLCQRYCISYIPSIQMLREMHNRAGIVKGEGFYAVINPQEDSRLVFSEYEGRSISRFFHRSKVDIGEIGTKVTVISRIPKQEYLHFSCHGSYNWNEPSKSGLYLAGGKTLSLKDLQNDIIDMSSARLVTLSACETGITDIVNSSADEFVGLPAGFMLAGVPCVVSSLWSVPDISTAILMERFYSNHIKRDMDIPMALQEAQLWVRDLTSGQVADYVEKCYHSGKWEGKSKDFIEQYRERYHKMAEGSTEGKPFQHPYYWAAFTVNGV